MKAIWKALLGLLFACLLAACGGGGDSQPGSGRDPGAGPEPITGTAYPITYNYQENGGNAVTKGPASAVGGLLVDLSPVASKPGWTFVGWNIDKNATTPLLSYTMPEHDLALYAIYSKPLRATFQDYAGASLSSRAAVATLYNKATSAAVTLPAQNTYNDGSGAWTPAGWSTQTAANAAPIAGNSLSISADTTFYGLYRRGAYTLSYNANGGTTTPPSQSAGQQANSFAIAVRANLPVILAGAISKPNATFDGWALNSATGAKYNAGASIQISANTVMFATWKDATPPVSQYPQYLGVHTMADADGSFRLHPPPNQAWFDEIIRTVGTKGKPGRRLAYSYTISFLNWDIETSKTVLKEFMRLSQANDLPIIIRLDGDNWWDKRPDLWNFWDNTKPGYSTANVDNVERYDWGTGTGTAVKIGWRYWGSQIRVAPAPNLAARKFRDAHTERLNVLLPMIKTWYDGLPADKKYLFGGLIFGWELSPYVQAYYLEGGNDLLNQPAANDPFQQWNTTGNILALGYAAAQTLGLQPEKGPIKPATIEAIDKDYLEFLIQTAIRNGIEPKRIITHSIFPGPVGNTYFGTKVGGGHTGSGAISDVADVVSGWSFPHENYAAAFDPLLNKVGSNRSWAAIEVPANHDELLTAAYIKGVMGYRNNRYFNIVNWEQIKDKNYVIRALQETLNE